MSLADLVLEAEATIAMSMRVARALDHAGSDESERLLLRLATPLGKYWICKRTPQRAVEAMECIGGIGVMEDTPMPRLFRASPVNAIWEGSGNILCLDVLRSVQKAPEMLEVYFAEMAQACSGNAVLDRHLTSLKRDWSAVKDREFSARSQADRLVLGLQVSLLARHAPGWLSEVFCQSHLDSPGHWQYGSLPLATIACGSSNGRCPRPTLEGFLAGSPVGAAQKPTSGDWPDFAAKCA